MSSTFVYAASTCKEVHITEQNRDRALDLTFVLDGAFSNTLSEDYSNIEVQLDNLIKQMRTMSPFNEFVDSKINIRYVKSDSVLDLQCCSQDPLISLGDCNHISTVESASICPTDEIIVFSSRGNQGDACDGAGGIANPGQQAGVYAAPGKGNLDEISWTILHELGHSMAFLADEYTYAEAFGPESEQAKRIKALEKYLSFVNAPNCERHPIFDENGVASCPKWRNVPSADCIQGCSYPNWYRPSQISMMHDDILQSPNTISEMQFRSAMNRYVDYVKEPISIEIHDKLEKFLLEKFLEKNPNWISINVPDMQFASGIEELNNPTNNGAANSLIEVLVNFAISGLTLQAYTCHNYHLVGKVDPTVSIKFNDIITRHNLKENSIESDFNIDMQFAGKASIDADGQIIGIDPTNPSIEIVRDCKDLLIINWNAKTPVIIKSKIKFSDGPLGIVRADPRITDIIIPKKGNINFKIDDNSFGILGFILQNIMDILDTNHFQKTYDYAAELEEDVRTYKDEFNENLDEFGLSLKTSLDALGLEQLADMGKPHGMILDVYAERKTISDTILTNGLEITPTAIRISGPASFNKPLLKNKAECVKNLPLNFEPIIYDSFDRVVGKPIDQEPFASTKLSQTFTNWFIATLWNDGYFCSEKDIPIADNPSFVPNIEQFELNQLKYTIIPSSPPYIDYTTLEDTNKDGITDINHDLVSKGKAKINLLFSYKLNELAYEEPIVMDFSYIIPMTLEEPDLTLSEDNGFSFAQSFFKSDIEQLQIVIDNIACKTGVVCDTIQLPAYKEALIQEIKENIASHMDRAIHEIEFNPIRDIDLNFGEVGGNMFTPPLNLNYGEFIADINTRKINEKWMTYDFNLVEKCAEGEYCGMPQDAIITNIKEIFYKALSPTECSAIPNSETISSGCRCIKAPTIESKTCIDALKSTSGDLHHYIKIDYSASPSEHVTYNFNLINWNSYKAPGKIYSVYFATSIETYNKLISSRNEQTGDIELIDKDSNIHTFTADATQIVTFRAKTEKGVEQDMDCMASVVFDLSPDMFDYQIKPVYATIEPRLRSDVNDQYEICAQEYVFPAGYSS